MGFVYLVAIIDWYSRYVLSWQLSISLEAEFCVQALQEAIDQYGSQKYLILIREYNLPRLILHQF